MCCRVGSELLRVGFRHMDCISHPLDGIQQYKIANDGILHATGNNILIKCRALVKGLAIGFGKCATYRAPNYRQTIYRRFDLAHWILNPVDCCGGARVANVVVVSGLIVVLTRRAAR